MQTCPKILSFCPRKRGEPLSLDESRSLKATITDIHSLHQPFRDDMLATVCAIFTEQAEALLSWIHRERTTELSDSRTAVITPVTLDHQSASPKPGRLNCEAGRLFAPVILFGGSCSTLTSLPLCEQPE